MAHPLTLIMPVVPGTSLPTISDLLAEYSDGIFTALQNTGTVHYGRLLLLDASTPNLQPGLGPNSRYIIALITEYDNEFKPYIASFVHSQVGAFFDKLLPLVVGGAQLVPVADNLVAVEAFLGANDASQQAPNTSLYQAYSCSVQDIRATHLPCAKPASSPGH
jgi:hypothetical protein